MSVRRACWWAGLSRSWLKYQARRQDERLVAELRELAMAHPRYGYRRLWAMLNRRRAGDIRGPVNLKRVRRLCRVHGLLLKARRRRKRRGIGCGLPCRAEYPNQVWAYDFVEDRTETGRKLRILTVEDEFTRECVTVEVEHRMSAKFVAQILLRLFAERGVPRFVRSDNGPEFIARHLMRVLAVAGVEARHIEPGSPWQNGRNERFNGSLRDECLNLHTFHNRDHARALVKLYGREYNHRRPHSSLGYLTPVEFAAWWAEQNKDGFAGGELLRLAPEAPPAAQVRENGPITGSDRPISRKAIHVGAPVARQQSRILRVDQDRLAQKTTAGEVPVIAVHLETENL